MRPARLALLVALASPMAACFGNEPTVFPPGLEPLDPENVAPPPVGTESDPYPEMTRIVQSSSSAYEWLHARAYVHANLADTWRALARGDVVADRRRGEWSVRDNVETGFDVSFLVHNVVHDLITIEFDITWREQAVKGTRDAPEVVAIRYQKTWGTSAIDLIAGSIIAQEVADGVTELQFIEHFSAIGSGEEDIRNYNRDLHASIVATVHGQPLPVWPPP